METVKLDIDEHDNPEKEGAFQSVIMLLKPGAAQFEQGIYEYCEKNNLIITGNDKLKFDEEAIKAFYPKSDGAAYLPGMVDHYSQAEVIALDIEGVNAMSILNRLKFRFRSVYKLEKPGDRFHVTDTKEEYDREKGVILDLINKDNLDKDK